MVIHREGERGVSGRGGNVKAGRGKVRGGDMRSGGGGGGGGGRMHNGRSCKMEMVRRKKYVAARGEGVTN